MTSRRAQSDAPRVAPKRLSADRHDDRQRRLVFFWVAGAVIFGLFVLLTRGKVTIIEEQTLWLAGFMRE